MCAPCSVGNCFEGKALHVKDGYHGTHNSVQSGKLVSLCERRLTKDASLFTRRLKLKISAAMERIVVQTASNIFRCKFDLGFGFSMPNMPQETI